MKIHYVRTLFAGFLLMPICLPAQDESFIYGKIYTVDNRLYEGPIRWGKEEVYWTDLFNASKERNENLRFLSHAQREALDDRHFRWNNWDGRFWKSFAPYWSDGDYHKDDEYLHQFACQFGEIKVIRPTGRKYVEVELQSGIKYDLNGEGYNDIGLNIKVADKEMGEVEIYWSRIEKIEFMNTPGKLPLKFGSPLYGTVEAFGEKFTGYIQWDHDERLSVDKLDGDSDDGDVSIEFGKIKSIERTGSRSRVVLQSGRELLLDGSNDVSSGHRGVIVVSAMFPSVDIPWSEFDKVTFTDKISSPLATYDQFKNQKELIANVKTLDGKSLSGKIVYDLDEAYDHELLQGKEGEFEFTTPFRNVKRITTKGEYRCLVELKNGVKLNLDEGQDVDERNQGLLVFASGQEQPTYVPWDEVSEVEFK